MSLRRLLICAIALAIPNVAGQFMPTGTWMTPGLNPTFTAGLSPFPPAARYLSDSYHLQVCDRREHDEDNWHWFCMHKAVGDRGKALVKCECRKPTHGRLEQEFLLEEFLWTALLDSAEQMLLCMNRGRALPGLREARCQELNLAAVAEMRFDFSDVQHENWNNARWPWDNGFYEYTDE